MTQNVLLREAVLHVLKRMQKDGRLAYLLGPGSEAYDLLTGAEAITRGIPADKFREEFEATLTYQKVPARSCREAGVAETACVMDVVETDAEFVYLGTPAEDDPEHNCDAMGCGQAHVLHRVNKGPQNDTGSMTQAALDVLAERQRQITNEGWTPEHDDGHINRALANAAGCYTLFANSCYPAGDPPRFWPWAKECWKPTTKRENLVKAGALILAEIERLDRAAANEGGAA